MREIEANRTAWAAYAEDHYTTYRKRLLEGTHRLNAHIDAELGDLSGKRVLHLQCNIGADTLLLARRGAAQVTGVDLVPGNIAAARRLAAEFGTGSERFLEADVMQLDKTHHERYDLVFVTEGCLCWLPDLAAWARIVRGLLAPGGSVYLYDSHPFYAVFDEARLAEGEYAVAYPYFSHDAHPDENPAGYASEAKTVQAYFWMHSFSEIIGSLAGAGLRLTMLHEFPELYYDDGGMVKDEARGLYTYPANNGNIPLSFSLRAEL